MARIPGSPYDIFVKTGQPINIAVTSDPANPPPWLYGDFNLEVVLYDYNPNGTPTPQTPVGYSALAMLRTDNLLLGAAHGDYAVVDTGSNHTLSGGDGNVTIVGGVGDTVQGSTGGNQPGNTFIDAHLGNQLVFGGVGNTTIWGGAGDRIHGGSGNETIAGAPGDTIIGGSGNDFIDGSRGNQSILGGLGMINTTIWGGAGDTIKGGDDFYGNETIGGAAGDTIVAGAFRNTFIGIGQSGQSKVWI